MASSSSTAAVMRRILPAGSITWRVIRFTTYVALSVFDDCPGSRTMVGEAAVGAPAVAGAPGFVDVPGVGGATGLAAATLLDVPGTPPMAAPGAVISSERCMVRGALTAGAYLSWLSSRLPG